MLKPFILYIENMKSGTVRDAMINAKDIFHARIIGENMITKKDETILTIYPYKYN